MTKLELLHELNAILSAEDESLSTRAQAENTEEAQWRLFRALVNIRPPRPVSKRFIELQDELLTQVSKDKGIVDGTALPELESGISLWQGDITRLKVDAIVNAANTELLGCFVPGHHCIDNEIHTYAGVQLRLDCNEIRKAIGGPDKVGNAQITKAYNLPARFVLHTAGPCVGGLLMPHHCTELASSYRSCLRLCLKHKLSSAAFCCISTGAFHFPPDKAAAIAVHEVRAFKEEHPKLPLKVIFNVFSERDLAIYQALLAHKN